MKPPVILSLIFLLAGVVLAGCMPSDPYTLQAAGNNYLESAHMQMTATAEAAIRANESAILSQAGTQSANDNGATATAQIIQSAATGTALYFEAQSTQAAATAQAIATQEAITVNATRQAFALAELQQGATVTASIQGTQTALDFDRQKSELARQKVVTVGGWVGLFVAVILALVLGWQFAQWAMKTASGRRSWVEGADAFAWDNGQGGVTIVTPRSMFQPALQLDKGGRATMPQLTAPNLQAYTKMAALAVEMEREKSKKPQWFTPIGKNGQGESFVPLPDHTTGAALPMPQLQPLPMLTDYHLLIAGGTGTGKTFTACYLLQGRQNAYVLDPHDNGETWPGHCSVTGGGRDFDAIAKTIGDMTTLLDNRFKMREMGSGGHFDPVTLAIDELPAIVANHPETVNNLTQIAREGRKVGIFLMLLSQSVLVRTLRLEGQSDTRENFATVKLHPLPPGQPKDTPRTATVIIGDINKPDSQEKYLVPHALDLVPNAFDLVPNVGKIGAGTGSLPVGTDGNQPQPGTAEESELIKALQGQGYSIGKIANLLGGRRQETLKRIQTTLGVVSV